jgi:Bacterial regulatory proteins, luxR family
MLSRAVGMRLGECLVSFLDETTSDELVPDGTPRPKPPILEPGPSCWRMPWQPGSPRRGCGWVEQACGARTVGAVDGPTHAMTNREIAQALLVTAKTVENQLGSACRKLSVRSRDELGRALASTQLT